MSHSNAPPVRNRAPLTARFSSLGVYWQLRPRYRSVLQYGQDKTPKESPKKRVLVCSAHMQRITLVSLALMLYAHMQRITLVSLALMCSAHMQHITLVSLSMICSAHMQHITLVSLALMLSAYMQRLTLVSLSLM